MKKSKIQTQLVNYLNKNKGNIKNAKKALVEDIKDILVAKIKENSRGQMMAYPINGTKPFEIKQDGTARKYENCLCVINVIPNGKKRMGVIARYIGKEDSYEAQVMARLVNAHIRIGFDESALKQAQEILNLDITEEIKNRVDRKKLPMIAVDPSLDCGDRDDAICVEKTKDGYRLYVAITDITHYVKPGSPLWNEAYIRATSHYTPTFSIPMFPREVTNTIFSLDEGRDRLVLCVAIDYDKNLNRKGYHFEEAVVNIHHAMDYKTFEAIKNGDLSLAKFEGEKEVVDVAYELAHGLYEKMKKENKIEADSDEPEFIKSKDGKDVIDVISADKSFSHKVIEMFMVEANLCAGDFFIEHNIDGIYRIHDKITQDKFADLKQVLRRYGIKYEVQNTSESISKLMEEIKKLPYSQSVQKEIISTFSRAEYAPFAFIHFGLGLLENKPYTHFTSDARRFSDIIAHLNIKDELHHRPISYPYNNIKTACMHINQQNSVADSTERKINKYTYCYLAEKRIGKTVDCVVSKINKDGILVRDKKSPMTFNISFYDLKDGNERIYSVSENGLNVTNGINTYKLGDEVKCQICDVDFDKSKIYASTNLEKVEQEILN